jgi:hypothetical protein
MEPAEINAERVNRRFAIFHTGGLNVNGQASLIGRNPFDNCPGKTYMSIVSNYSGLRVREFRVQEISRAGAIVCALYGRLRPAAIGFGQLLLKGAFHAIEHPKALLINDQIFQPSIGVHLSLANPYIFTLNPEPPQPE